MKPGDSEGLPSNYHSSVSAGAPPGIGRSSPGRTDQGRDQFWFQSVRSDTVKSIVLDVAWGVGER